jgi:predicted Mrr-cat superfamily restriction endonuclease
MENTYKYIQQENGDILLKKNIHQEKRYWYIKIHRNDDNFETERKYCIENKSIGIGFGIKDENLNLEEDELKMKCKEKLGEDDYKSDFRFYNTFINIIKNDDIVFLCKGEDEILYIAEIAGDYYYDNTQKLPHRRKLKNIKEFKTTATKRMVATIYEV